eukprot:jgi/Botrbrau1/6347/Bobra.0098s0006.1
MAFCFYDKGVPPNGWMGSYPSTGPLQQPPCELSKLELDVGGGRQVSVKEAYSGAGIFITGATGYVGSVVIEQLLRLVPDLRKIYILIRKKRGKTGEQRLDELLAKKLFDLLRGPDGKLLPELREKLVAVEGDVDGDNCSMKPADVKLVQEGTNYIVHCAASISFFEHVHVLLTQNYQATRKLMKLAHTMPNMKGFIHVSTAYVNCNLPQGSHIEEKIYPLILKDGTKLDHAKVADELLALSPKQATKRAAYYINDLGFPNAYTLSKHMAEDLVTDLHLHPFPVSIVRPSIIGCLAYSPVPGYFGNAAGLTNMILAFASGMARFSCHDPNHVWDLIPCDMVGSLILAAGAALYKGAYHKDRPLVLHACSSVSNGERYGDLFCADIFTYWSNDQPKRRFTPGPYKPVEHWTAFLPETTFTFKLLTLKHTIKYRILSAMGAYQEQGSGRPNVDRLEGVQIVQHIKAGFPCLLLQQRGC